MANVQERGRESIILTLIKAIFEGAVEKMELVVIISSQVNAIPLLAYSLRDIIA